MSPLMVPTALVSTTKKEHVYSYIMVDQSFESPKIMISNKSLLQPISILTPTPILPLSLFPNPTLSLLLFPPYIFSIVLVFFIFSIYWTCMRLMLICYFNLHPYPNPYFLLCIPTPTPIPYPYLFSIVLAPFYIFHLLNMCVINVDMLL